MGKLFPAEDLAFTRTKAALARFSEVMNRTDAIMHALQEERQKRRLELLALYQQNQRDLEALQTRLGPVIK